VCNALEIPPFKASYPRGEGCFESTSSHVRETLSSLVSTTQKVGLPHGGHFSEFIGRGSYESVTDS